LAFAGTLSADKAGVAAAVPLHLPMDAALRITSDGCCLTQPVEFMAEQKVLLT
jgi:hypothetical protein